MSEVVDNRCTATVHSGPRAGQRCAEERIAGTSVCARHGANLPTVQKHANELLNEARMLLALRADSAVASLLELMDNAATDAVRLKATTEVLDRVGVRGGTDLHVSTDDSKARADQIIAERLDRLRGSGRKEPAAEPDTTPVVLEIGGPDTEPLEGELLPPADSAD